MRKRVITLLAPALSLCAGMLHASVVYNLRVSRYFPDGPNAPYNTNQSAAFAFPTSDSIAASYSSDGSPSANTFDGSSAVNTGPFTLGTDNAVTIETDTSTFQNLGILSIVESGISETGMTITGGSGTGYLLPTFHVTGVISDTNPNAFVSDLICAGNSACLLSNIFGPVTSGVHNVDGFYTPAIGSNTSFQFGAPFGFFFFFGSGVENSGNASNAGGTATADLTLDFAGFQVVDAGGNPIPGARIDSRFLDVVNAPEPGTAGLAAMAALGIAVGLRRRGAARNL